MDESGLLPLLRISPNKSCGMVLDSRATSPQHTEMFHFLGKLIGMAVRTNNVLTIKLAPLIWKMLVEQDVEVEDLMEVNPGLRGAFEFLKEPQTVLEQAAALLPDEAICFTADASLLTTFTSEPAELRAGGRELLVTEANLSEYLEDLEGFVWREVHELTPMVAAVRKGICDIIPSLALRLLTGTMT